LFVVSLASSVSATLAKINSHCRRSVTGFALWAGGFDDLAPALATLMQNVAIRANGG
jgi:hypothetical protein